MGNVTPILIGAAAFLLLSGGRSKKSSKKRKPTTVRLRTGYTYNVDPDLRVGPALSFCRPGKSGPGDGVEGALSGGPENKCITFWDADTGAAVKASLERRMEEMSPSKRAKICKLTDKTQKPVQDALVKSVISELWPGIDMLKFPPPPSAEYLYKMIWTKVYGVYSYEACGYPLIT